MEPRRLTPRRGSGSRARASSNRPARHQAPAAQLIEPPPAMPATVASSDTSQVEITAQADALAGAGRGSEAVMLLDRAIAASTSGRDRFLLELHLAELCVRLGNDQVAACVPGRPRAPGRQFPPGGMGAPRAVGTRLRRALLLLEVPRGGRAIATSVCPPLQARCSPRDAKRHGRSITLARVSKTGAPTRPRPRQPAPAWQADPSAFQPGRANRPCHINSSMLVTAQWNARN